MKWLVALIVAASCGGSPAPPPATPLPPETAQPAPEPPSQQPITRREQVMQEMAALADKMCACQAGDRACAERVQQELSDFSQDSADLAEVKMSDADQRRASELTTRMGKCASAAMGDLLAVLHRFRDATCACTDKPCADGVMKDMQAYSDAHPELAHARMTDADVKAATVLGQEMARCAAAVRGQ